MTGPTTATVQTLQASVQTLLVGTRQVTMSVYLQLDTVPAGEMQPFGRVRPRDAQPGWLYLVGRHTETGSLVRAVCPSAWTTILCLRGSHDSWYRGRCLAKPTVTRTGNQ